MSLDKGQSAWENFHSWVLNDFTVICQNFSRTKEFGDLHDACTGKYMPVWSYIVRHVKPRSEVIRVRKKLEIYRSRLRKNKSDATVTTRADFSYRLCALSARKNFLTKQVLSQEKELNEYHTTKISQNYSLNSHSCMLRTIALHYIFSNLSNIKETIHNMDHSAQNLSKVEFDVQKMYSALEALCRKVLFEEKIYCEGKEISVDVSYLLKMYSDMLASRKSFEEIFQCKVNNDIRTWERDLLNIRGFDNFQDSSVPVDEMRSIQLKSFMRRERSLKKISAWFAENPQFADSYEKINLCDLSRAEQLCAILSAQNSAMKCFDAGDLKITDPKETKIVSQGHELHADIQKLRDTAQKLLFHSIVVKDLSEKQKNLQSRSLHSVEHNIELINESKANFCDLQTLIRHPLLKQTLAERQHVSVQLIPVPSFHNPSLLMKNILHVESNLYFLKLFIFNQQQMQSEFKELYKIISSIPSLSCVEVGVLDQCHMSRMKEFLSKAVEFLGIAEASLHVVKANVLEWWEQPAASCISYQ